MADGAQVLSLLDVLPVTFGGLPDSLTPAQKTRAIQLMQHARSIAEWLPAGPRLRAP